jgi:hypothetical protein
VWLQCQPCLPIVMWICDRERHIHYEQNWEHYAI